MLEELERARAHGARIYAEIVGYGAKLDGYDMVAPSGVGRESCMDLAMAEADRHAGEKPVEYTNTHGKSTPVGNVAELGAIKRAKNPRAYVVKEGERIILLLGLWKNFTLWCPKEVPMQKVRRQWHS